MNEDYFVGMKILDTLDIPVWRLLVTSVVATPSAPAKAPHGRFHHSGQVAAYASLSAEGASVAIKRYLGDNVERKLVAMRLRAVRVADVRGDPDASVVWQHMQGNGSRPTTWAFSDAARQRGAQAMLYSSRSRPDLSHVVVFEPNCLIYVGPITPFDPSATVSQGSF